MKVSTGALAAPFPVLLPVIFRGQRLDGYEISTDGKVWSCLSARWLKPYNVAKGYQGLALRSEGRTIRVTVHALVAEAYIGPRPVGADVCHSDGDPKNNCAKNLRYASRSSNIADKLKHGTSQHGERNPQSKLSNLQAEEIRSRRKAGERLAYVAADYGVAVSTISRIANGSRRAVE